MSRIGKKLIVVPQGVEVSITDEAVVVKGPKGQLEQALHPRVTVNQDEDGLRVTVVDPSVKQDNALWGLYASLLMNMVTGVTEGYEKKLEVNGVGYKVAASGNKVTLNVGYSHPVDFTLPEGVQVAVEKNVITLTGINKQLVGQTAADIRKVRKPEPYKGKGIKYVDEVIQRKAGKAGKAA
jgi:large subunit ribosomal protein L6